MKALAARTLVSTYDESFGDGLLLGAWNGSTFSQIPQKNGIRVTSSDAEFALAAVRRSASRGGARHGRRERRSS